MTQHNSFQALSQLDVEGQTYHYFDLQRAQAILGPLQHLPKSLKVLLENLLRHEDGESVKAADIQALVNSVAKGAVLPEIQYRPARVLMQDFTGVPAVVDLAAMREAMARLGGDPEKINPLSPVDLVIDHSVMVDYFGKPQAFDLNVQLEMQRNQERYQFLRWGQQAFDGFRVVPPGTGICHQVNLEYLAQTVWTKQMDGQNFAFPDTLVGTDSHTTMINGLGVLGWGVGGIEAEAAMLGQPVSMLVPKVVGFKLSGQLKEGITATDLVLTVTHMLRSHGVVGKFVEFFGDGLADLSLADRATIANMAPEYGATCGFFPVDEVTLQYLRLTGRDPHRVALVEAYCREQGLWREAGDEPIFDEVLALDMGSVQASLAGPKRPQDQVVLSQVRTAFRHFMDESASVAPKVLANMANEGGDANAVGATDSLQTEPTPAKQPTTLHHGAVVIAAITSCTNTSNPSVMMAAGLLAKNAVAKGLQRQAWVKSSLAPGSKVVTEYLDKAQLLEPLAQLGFDVVGYGCTTCIGNSGPLLPEVAAAIDQEQWTVASVLSGNRNFEGRVHPQVKTNWLASPPLVVAYALAGSVTVDLSQEPLGHDAQGNAVYLRDIWPSNQDVQAAVAQVQTQMFERQYGAVFEGDATWKSIAIPPSQTYAWNTESTYIQHPPFFDHLGEGERPVTDIHGAHILALLGDSVTTDHISPAGNIQAASPAGRYLQDKGVLESDFNSYGSRRGNHEVMMRGTFANIRIKNEMLDGIEGGYSLHVPSQSQGAIYDVAMQYQLTDTPLIVIAGKEYGTGSSRDWAAKGTLLLGVKAVLAESFERIHRSNLVGMGVLPLQFLEGETRVSLGLTGNETIHILGLQAALTPQQRLSLHIVREDGSQHVTDVLCRIDTLNEVAYFKAGGILHYVLKKLMAA